MSSDRRPTTSSTTRQPHYFDQPIEQATLQKTLDASLRALRLELPVDVAEHHERIVREMIAYLETCKK